MWILFFTPNHGCSARNTTPLRRHVRYLDWFAVNARTTLRSLAPALAKKCMFYSTHISCSLNNIHRTVYEFQCKGYPRAWWANALVKS